MGPPYLDFEGLRILEFLGQKSERLGCEPQELKILAPRSIFCSELPLLMHFKFFTTRLVRLYYKRYEALLRIILCNRKLEAGFA